MLAICVSGVDSSFGVISTEMTSSVTTASARLSVAVESGFAAAASARTSDDVDSGENAGLSMDSDGVMGDDEREGGRAGMREMIWRSDGRNEREYWEE